MGKERARDLRDIVRQQRDPALLEYVGCDLFQARIFPIPPGGQRTIELTYCQVLPKGKQPSALYLSAACVSAARLAGVPNTSNLSASFAIRADIEATSPIKAIYLDPFCCGPSETVSSRRSPATRIQRHSNQRFSDLFYSVDEGEIGLSLLSYKAGRRKDGCAPAAGCTQRGCESRRGCGVM